MSSMRQSKWWHSLLLVVLVITLLGACKSSKGYRRMGGMSIRSTISNNLSERMVPYKITLSLMREVRSPYLWRTERNIMSA